MKKLSEKGHHWDWCGMCGFMVRCGTCGNNCCNGGYGNNGTCPDCHECYKIQKNPTKSQLFDLALYLQNMINDFYGSHVSRDLLLKHAKKINKIRPLKKIFELIDQNDPRYLRTISDSDLDEWFNDETEEILTESEKRQQHLDYMASKLHYAYRNGADKYKVPKRLASGSRPKWDDCSDEYKEFLIDIVKYMGI